jgi:bacillithiol biosynthesis deacetylase BshB1
VTRAIPKSDLLCVATHTDDAEIGLGATLRLLADRGRTIWVCDLSRGELASNATPEQRWQEAGKASALMHLHGRLQLQLPDGFISREDPVQVAAVTAVIRLLCPRWIVCAPMPVRHPDHQATPSLVDKASFMADLIKYRPDPPSVRSWPEELKEWKTAPRWRCEAVLEVCPPGAEPSLIFDVSETWRVKQEALACYSSQFHRDHDSEPTYINEESFMAHIEQQGRAWGARAGTTYGEALRTRAVPLLQDLPREEWM